METKFFILKWIAPRYLSLLGHLITFYQGSPPPSFIFFAWKIFLHGGGQKVSGEMGTPVKVSTINLKKNKEAYSLVSSFCLILCVGIYALDKAAASASLEGLALYTETLMLNIAYFLDVLKPL